MMVDHASPIHDHFCRCRSCKPPLVGQRSQNALRAKVAGTVIAVTLASAAAFRAVLS